MLPASVANRLRETGAPVIRRKSAPPRKQALPDQIFFPLAPDHLIVLIQYNVLRASRYNRDLLLGSGLFAPGTLSECDASITHTLPPLASPALLPPALHPTALQRAVPHEDWIDLMPHPAWRDNLIAAAGKYDEEAMWSDCLGGLFEGFPADEVEWRGVAAWAPSWDVSGWEMSEGFKVRWGWLFRGCEEVVLEATNRWRRQRGEEAMVWEIDELE